MMSQDFGKAEGEWVRYWDRKLMPSEGFGKPKLADLPQVVVRGNTESLANIPFD